MQRLEAVDWAKLIDSLIKQGRLRSPSIIQAFRVLPRAKFLPPKAQLYAASDMPLQIGLGQTIPAPHIAAVLDEELQLELGNKTLEVGGGSGWHACTIAEVVAPTNAPRSEWGHVHTIEILPAIAETARKNIINSGYADRVTIVTGDGSKGYQDRAPYDRILVNAATPKIPKPLLDQLKVNGILLVPVGDATLFQTLKRITKQEDGKVKEENLGSVAFDPLSGEFGFPSKKI